VLIVYSCWVQIVTVKTTPLYITSIVRGWAGIVDKMEIHYTPWFNFLDATGRLQILLCSFKGILLEPKKAVIVKIPPQGMQPNSQRMQMKQKKRKLVNTENSRSKRERSGLSQFTTQAENFTNIHSDL